MSDQSQAEPGEKRRPSGCFFRVVVLALLLGILCLLAVAIGVYGFGLWAGLDTREPGAALQKITIEPGDSFDKVAQKLSRVGLARPAWAMKLLARRENATARLQPGAYVFPAGASPVSILQEIQKPRLAPNIEVTLPEGWTVEQMAERLEKAGVLMDADALVDLCYDPEYVAALGFPGSSLQGFLFPDTYAFDPQTPPRAVIERLTRRFRQVLVELNLWPGQNSEQAYSLLFAEYVTLASIIEREARDPAEMPRIASVFHNRLRKKMRLDSCATVRYAINQWDAPLKQSDLKTDSPYNTYQVQGLPPGPICNPGRAALLAAFLPEESDFLYYVYKGDGQHVFSRTLREHGENRRKYRDAWQFSARKPPQ